MIFDVETDALLMKGPPEDKDIIEVNATDTVNLKF
jgi:hypothetical protein